METPRPLSSAWFWWSIASITAVFGLVRFACLHNDLWLDEIWSLGLLTDVHSPWEILSRVRHDNNHPLNSLLLYALMPAKADWTYRLLSWSTGTFTIAIAAIVGRRLYAVASLSLPDRVNLAGVITAILFGSAHLFVQYSSEARGYAPAVCCGLIAVYAMLRAPDLLWRWPALYGLASIIGLLAHGVMFQLVLGGLVWSVVRALRGDGPWRDRLKELARWQLTPVLFFAIYYVGFLSRLEIGGGPPHQLARVLADCAAFTIGWPDGAGRWWALALFIGVSLGGLIALWRRDRSWAWFYIVSGVLAPALPLASSHFTLLFPRYFIMSSAVALLLSGVALATLWGRTRVTRMFISILLIGFMMGNAVHTARLRHDGRGQYQAALRYVAQRTPSLKISLSSDYDDRNLCVISYYSRAAGQERAFDYCRSEEIATVGPQWLFLHRLDDSPLPQTVPAGKWEYQLAAVFPHAPLSGWDWFVYLRTPAIR